MQRITKRIPDVRRAAPAALLVAGLAATMAAGADFTKYHNAAELTASLQEAVKAHADISRLVEIGKSREGRPIWAVEIANPRGTAVESRPALLIAANFEGDQVIGSEIALFIVDHLLNGYAANPEIRQRLDSSAVYVVPRVNPDGAELMFSPVKTGWKTNSAPFDDDNDGRIDEDGPEDLNNDGVITVMRVKDPRGDYMIHPDDPRLMKKADPQRGEAGAYRIYWEGIDNDRDGFINEDGPGGVDLNRNFQHKYPYYSPDAGRHMVSEPESRALMDYVIGHRNIAMILTFGESDNLITAVGRRGELGPASPIDLLAFAQQSTAEARTVGVFQISPGFRRGFRGGGPGSEEAGPMGRGQQPAARGQQARRPAETVNTEDIEYFRTISDRYRVLTGLRSAPAVRVPAGAFFEYGYYQFGVPSFSTPGWGLPASPRGEGEGARILQRPAEAQPPAGVPAAARRGLGAAPAGAAAAEPGRAAGGGEFDLRLLRWMDAEKIDGFVPWTPFKHPTLGEVEIGGFRPYACSNPPAARIAELGKAHGDFVLYLTSLFAKVSIAETSVANLGGGLFRIKAEIANTGYLPTATAHGVVSRSVKPTMVQIDVAPERIVSGDAKTVFFQALAGSGRRQKYEWIVRGKPGETVNLKAVSQKGGSDSVAVTLR